MEFFYKLLKQWKHIYYKSLPTLKKENTVFIKIYCIYILSKLCKQFSMELLGYWRGGGGIKLCCFLANESRRVTSRHGASEAPHDPLEAYGCTDHEREGQQKRQRSGEAATPKMKTEAGDAQLLKAVAARWQAALLTLLLHLNIIYQQQRDEERVTRVNERGALKDVQLNSMCPGVSVKATFIQIYNRTLSCEVWKHAQRWHMFLVSWPNPSPNSHCQEQLWKKYTVHSRVQRGFGQNLNRATTPIVLWIDGFPLTTSTCCLLIWRSKEQLSKQHGGEW